MITLSRSQIETRQKCPSLEYWTYRYGGLGLRHIATALPLTAGIYTHAALARALQGMGLDMAIATTLREYREALADGVVGLAHDDLPMLIQEQSRLLDGLVRGWVRFRLPQLLDEFRVLSVEQELEWTLESPEGEPILVQVRMDGVLEHRYTDELHILDFKTVGNPSKQWEEAFEHSLQTVLYTGAARQLYPGRSIAGVLYEGLCNGGRRWAGKTTRWHGMKIQSSPLCYLYSDGTTYQKGYTSRKGWQLVAAWESNLGPADWCEHAVGEDTWRELFWHVPTLRPPDWEIDQELARLVQDEVEHQRRIDRLAVDVEAPGHWDRVQTHIPKHRFHCRPWNGSSCPMYELCFEPNVGADPLRSGLFAVRDPHHPLVDEPVEPFTDAAASAT